MQEIPSVLWTDKSGKKYRYWVYDYPKNFPSKPGNFIICKIIGTGWRPIFIGYTDDLSKFTDTIHDMECIERCFATHVHAHFNPESEAERLDEAKSILNQWGSECQTD